VCTGYGGLDLAVLNILGGRIVWCADPDPHIRTILDARMPGVPNLGDIRRLDWRHVPTVQVLTAGFPCQDISNAGHRAGIQKGNRSGLWHHIHHGIRHLRPPLVFLENVDAIRLPGRGFDVVLGDLASAGYDTSWCCLPAAAVGAPHLRRRLFVLACTSRTPRVHPDHVRRQVGAAA